MATRAQVRAALAAKIADRVRELTINVAAELRAVTPVDTGFAAGNWQTTIGAPAAGTVGIGAASSAAAVLASYDPERDGSTYTTNNAQYIQRLNAGHSKQAPAAFVEQAIARVVAA